MLRTLLDGKLEPGQESALESAYAAAAASTNRPPGLVRSEMRDAFDPNHLRIQTWWLNRQALEAMRATGTPAGILIFRAAGAAPIVSVFEVMDSVAPVET